MEHIRHGDILLTRIDSLPEGEELKHDGEYVLAYGEITGHAHRLTSEGMKVVKCDGIIYMSLVIPAPLTHEEHKTIEIPAGIYRLNHEREYDPFLEAVRSVAD